MVRNVQQPIRTASMKITAAWSSPSPLFHTQPHHSFCSRPVLVENPLSSHFSSPSCQDGEAYTLLLHQLAPEKCDLSPLSCSGLERAQRVLQQADRIGCCKYLQAQDIVDGLQNLNLAFVANLFHTMTK